MSATTNRTLLVALGLGGAVAIATLVTFQFTTDLGVLTTLGIIGAMVGGVVFAVALKKLPAHRLGLVAGALLGTVAAGVITYQTFFAINDEQFVKTQAESTQTQADLDAAFDDDF